MPLESKHVGIASRTEAWPRRITEQLLRRLVESGLVDVFEYDDGERTLAIVGWRDFRPVDLTSAERKRRFRRRLYGSRYYGTEGEVTEVRLPPETDEEVTAIEAEGRALLTRLERGEQVLPMRESGKGEGRPDP